MNPPVLLLYCQHSLGLGHLRRSWALAEALARRFDVVMLSGGAPASGLRPPADVRIVELPPLDQDVSGRLVSADPDVSVAEAQRRRAEIVLQTFRSCCPAVVLIELFPFGRKKFAGE